MRPGAPRWSRGRGSRRTRSRPGGRSSLALKREGHARHRTGRPRPHGLWPAPGGEGRAPEGPRRARQRARSRGWRRSADRDRSREGRCRGSGQTRAGSPARTVLRLGQEEGERAGKLLPLHKAPDTGVRHVLPAVLGLLQGPAHGTGPRVVERNPGCPAHALDFGVEVGQMGPSTQISQRDDDGLLPGLRWFLGLGHRRRH